MSLRGDKRHALKQVTKAPFFTGSVFHSPCCGVKDPFTPLFLRSTLLG